MLAKSQQFTVLWNCPFCVDLQILYKHKLEYNVYLHVYFIIFKFTFLVKPKTYTTIIINLWFSVPLMDEL